MRKRIVVLIVLVAASVGMGQESLAAQSGTIMVGQLQEPTTLEPYLNDDMTSSRWVDLIYGSLVKMDKNMEIVPDLAREWEVGRDEKGRTTVTFTLRENLYWHDGMPVISGDVIATYNVVTDPTTPTNQHSRFFGIEKIERIDDKSLVVTFSNNYSAGLGNLTFKILPAHLLGEGPYTKEHRLVHKPVGTGPFKFSSWTEGQYLMLKANKEYYREGLPKLGSIVIRFYGNQNTLLSAMELGDVHMMFDVPPKQIPRFKNNRHIDVYNYFAHAYDFIAFNLNRPPFDNKEVREAITLAVDRAGMIEQIYQGHAHQISGPFPITSWAYNSAVQPREYNLEKARNTLDRLGISDKNGNSIREYNGEDLSFTILFLKNNDLLLQRILAFKAQLKKLGIDIQAKPKPLKQFMELVFEKRDFDMFTSGWNVGVHPDPYSVWFSGEIGEGLNSISYYNEKVDSLILEARRTDDKQEQKLRYFQIHKIIHNDAPYIFLWTRERTLALSRDFKKFSLNSFNLTRGLIYVESR